MTRLGFDPQLPLALIAALAIVAVLITAYGFAMRARRLGAGTGLRHSHFRAVRPHAGA